MTHSHFTSLPPLPCRAPSAILARTVFSITTTFLWGMIFSGCYLFPSLAGVSEKLIGSAGGVFWMFTLICLLAFVFGWRMMPATRGRTREQIADTWRTKSA